ncbi:hypothetical protein BDV96DRAFT_503734 [Lophiotrema nucula]|uniref:Uncharacterized protein n=1 Tax=Lophiotrema nucula TaxID=690887 RepID=A0A6A5YNU3_9PLEO|nr:hypothetical protein BDV96DRAFT_503734 [Lophiotrema nucula]
MVELFSFLGFPARVAGRALLAFRYVSNRGATAKVTGDYAELRFGRTVRWRPWLMIDVKELEETEELINRGTDAQVESWRVSQLSVCGMIAIIGALVASAGVTALQLPGLEDCHFVARGTFVMSLILSLMSVFFSGLQQSSFGRASEARDLRLWLASGGFWNDKTLKTELRSSMVAHMILQAPFEIVVMSITLFVVGLGTYLGSSWKLDLPLTTGKDGNRAVLIAFIIPTVFVLLMYGHMMGLKDRELVKAADVCDAQMMAEQMKSKVSSSGDVEAIAHQEVDNAILAKSTGVVVSELSSLREALQAAADAQRKCAQANEEVARQYERLLRVH